MDFSLSQEQQMLSDSVAKFIQNDYTFEQRQVVAKGDRGYNQAHWQLFAELGWLMVPFREEDGGLGGNATDLMVVMQEFGKGLFIEPYLAATVLAGGALSLAGNAAQKTEYIGGTIEGRLLGALAHTEADSRYDLAAVSTQAQQTPNGYRLSGHKVVVLSGGNASFLVVSARTAGGNTDKQGISLFIVPADATGVDIHSYRTHDGGRAAEIQLSNVEVGAEALLGNEGEALPIIESVIDRACLAVCAEAVGAMEAALAKTVEYSKTRVQFGVPISSFQALQHRMAELYVEIEQAKSLVLMASLKLDANAEDGAKMVSAMKSQVGRIGHLVGQETIQIHGAIAMTDELDVGHYFKRLVMIDLLFGNSSFHTRRFIQS